MLCIARGFNMTANPRVCFWNRRGKDNEITQLAKRIRRQAARIGAGLIIIDPIYKTYGDREENSNTEMAQVLNELENSRRTPTRPSSLPPTFPRAISRDAMLSTV